MQVLLKDNNFEYKCVPSVDNAISIFKDGTFFDLIIVEANLPHLPGTELVKFAKQNKKYRTIPIIVTSSSFKSNDIVKYIEYAENINKLLGKNIFKIIHCQKIRGNKNQKNKNNR